MITQYITPIFICGIIILALVRKKPVYSNMIEGAVDGLNIVKNIIPSIILIMAAVGGLKSSGFIDFISSSLAPITSKLGIPPEIIPLAIMRPISGSGALGILSSNLKEYGADTEIGKICSVIMGSTETTFYVLALYFGKTSVQNTKRAVFCAVASDIVAIFVGVWVVKLIG